MMIQATRWLAVVLCWTLANTTVAGSWAKFDLGDVQFEDHHLAGVTVELAPGAKAARLTVREPGWPRALAGFGALRLLCSPVVIHPAAIDCIGGTLTVRRINEPPLTFQGRFRWRRRSGGFELSASPVETPLGSLSFKLVKTGRLSRLTLNGESLSWPAADLADMSSSDFSGGRRGQGAKSSTDVAPVLQQRGAIHLAFDADLSVAIRDGMLSGAAMLRAKRLDVAHADSLLLPALSNAGGVLRLDLSGDLSEANIAVVGTVDAGWVSWGGGAAALSELQPLRFVAQGSISDALGTLHSVDVVHASGLMLNGTGQVRFLTGDLMLSGSGSLPVLGGTVTAPIWRFVRPPGGLWSLRADGVIKQLSLPTIAARLGFGTIAGELDGKLSNVVIQANQPPRFDAHFWAPVTRVNAPPAWLDAQAIACLSPAGPLSGKSMQRYPRAGGEAWHQAPARAAIQAVVAPAVRISSAMIASEIVSSGMISLATTSVATALQPGHAWREPPGAVRAVDRWPYRALAFGCRMREGRCLIEGHARDDDSYLLIERMNGEVLAVSAPRSPLTWEDLKTRFLIPLMRRPRPADLPIAYGARH